MPDIFEGDQVQMPSDGVVPSASYTAADPAVVTLDTDGATGLRVGINITAISGAGCTLTVTIRGIDPVSGATYVLLASAGLVATGLTELVIDPRIVAVANSIAQTELPSRVTITAVGTGTKTTLTYSISATLSQ